MNLKQAIPAPLKTLLKNTLPNKVIDELERWTGLRDDMTPPSRLMYVGDGDYHTIGQHFAARFKEYGKLKPTDSVLDVGSGTGRMAVPLLAYLSEGTYTGLEIVKDAVDWFNSAVHRKHPNFEFHHLDVYNKMYNPGGKMQGADVRFPLPDSSYDFVLLTSVFTHMLEKDFEQYLSEISRVMKEGANAYFTMFLLTAESKELVAKGKAKYRMMPYTDKTMVADKEVPEYMIAFDEAYVLRSFEAAGLQLESIHYGSWPGRSTFLDYQDTVLVTKK